MGGETRPRCITVDGNDTNGTELWGSVRVIFAMWDVVRGMVCYKVNEGGGGTCGPGRDPNTLKTVFLVPFLLHDIVGNHSGGNT